MVDPLAGGLVFVAPQRAERPIELEASGGCNGSGEWHATCPFCMGNESLSPAEVLRVASPIANGWLARIVPNGFPFVATTSAEQELPGERTAFGVHEVLVESPRHDTRVEDVTEASWLAAWEAGRRRLAMLADRRDLSWAMLFKNSGPRAGASLSHVHSQIVAVDFLPPSIRRKESRLRRHRDLHATIVARARRDGRVWAEVGGLVAFVPEAPRQPFESTIMSATPQPHFHAAGAESVAALADLTRRFTRRLAALTETPDYNWWLHQAPFSAFSRSRSAAPPEGAKGGAWHWHVEIVPRLTSLAGFELGTGCHVVTLPSQQAARLLSGA